jgi:type III secretion protein J
MRASLAAVSLAVLGCGSRVQHGLDERQANEIQTVLVERGFVARKVVEEGRPPTWAVEVAAADASEAVRVLAALGLPRPRPAGVKELVRPGLVPDPLEQHVLLLEAQSGELARTLEGVDGVLSARVHLVRATVGRGGVTASPAKAAIYLRVQSAAPGHLSAMREELRALVAGAVEGLEPAAVTLVLSEVASPVFIRAAEVPSGPWSVPLLALGVGSVAVVSVSGSWWLLRRRGTVKARARTGPAPPAARPLVQGPLRAAGE